MQPDVGAGGIVATTDKTAYLATGTVLHVDGGDDPTEVGQRAGARAEPACCVAATRLNVTRDCAPAPADPDGAPRIGCTLPEVFDHARVGEKIFFDDGRIGGEILAVGPDMLQVRIERAARPGSKLRAAKGINLPDTRAAGTGADRKGHRGPAPRWSRSPIWLRCRSCRTRPMSCGCTTCWPGWAATDLGVVLKIETRRAFERLPQLLLTAMRRPRSA